MDDLFTLQGKSFCYQVSDYNSTNINERAVEVPVGLALLRQATSQELSILEVGAVLPHYRVGWPCDGHVVVDLHEVYPGVINADVLTWEPQQPFDLIVSISTLEHLRDRDEFIDALVRLTSWLAPGGLLYVTLPYGQPAWVGGGEWIDRFLYPPTSRWVEQYDGRTLLRPTIWRMDKIDPICHLWEQADLAEAPLAYNGQSMFANSVYLVIFGDARHWWEGIS